MANNLVARVENVLPSLIQRERTACPFYGFDGQFGVFLDSEGNQCGLASDGYRPCQMEVGMKENPDYGECPYISQDYREQIEFNSGSIRIFPNEFHPEGQREWEGISLKDWIEHIKANS